MENRRSRFLNKNEGKGGETSDRTEGRAGGGARGGEDEDVTSKFLV